MIIRKINEVPATPTAHGIGLKQVLLASTETSSAVTQIARTTLREGEEVELHVHQTMDEHYYFLSGKGVMVVDDEAVMCAEGVYMLVPQGARHALKAETEMTFITIGVAYDK